MIRKIILLTLSVLMLIGLVQSIKVRFFAPCAIRLTMTQMVTLQSASAMFVYDYPASDQRCKDHIGSGYYSIGVYKDAVLMDRYPTSPIACKVLLADGGRVTVIEINLLGKLACEHLPTGAVLEQPIGTPQ